MRFALMAATLGLGLVIAVGPPLAPMTIDEAIAATRKERADARVAARAKRAECRAQAKAQKISFLRRQRFLKNCMNKKT